MQMPGPDVYFDCKKGYTRPAYLLPPFFSSSIYNEQNWRAVSALCAYKQYHILKENHEKETRFYQT